MTQTVSLDNCLQQWRERFNQLIATSLDSQSQIPAKLKQAMLYSLKNGGKRLRPLLVYATGTAFNAELKTLDNAALAMEFIHTYSLIHDDLPAMDDDDLRRGKPSCHKAFDEATAILAGDALQSLAFNILSKPTATLCCEQQSLMVQTLAQASSHMVYGQQLDLDAEGIEIDRAALEQIHRLKTGQLFTASILLGAIAAGQLDPKTREILASFGNKMGLAFQITDDILDITSSSEQLGKPQGSDADHDKATYPKLMGLDNAKQLSHELLESALAELQSLPQDFTVLKAIAYQMVQRQY